MQLDVHAAPEHGAQVGGAGAEEAEALAPAEGAALLLDQTLHLRPQEATLAATGQTTTRETCVF